MGLSGYGNKYLEIYLRLECLGGNIGEIYHFALEDVFGLMAGLVGREGHNCLIMPLNEYMHVYVNYIII